MLMMYQHELKVVSDFHFFEGLKCCELPPSLAFLLKYFNQIDETDSPRHVFGIVFEVTLALEDHLIGEHFRMGMLKINNFLGLSFLMVFIGIVTIIDV